MLLSNSAALSFLFVAITASANNVTPWKFKIKEQGQDICITPDINDKGELTGVKRDKCADADTWSWTDKDGNVVVGESVGDIVSNRNFTVQHALDGCDLLEVYHQNSIKLLPISAESDGQRWRTASNAQLILPDVGGHSVDQYCLTVNFGIIEAYECKNADERASLNISQLWEWA